MNEQLGSGAHRDILTTAAAQLTELAEELKQVQDGINAATASESWIVFGSLARQIQTLADTTLGKVDTLPPDTPESSPAA